MTLTESGYPAKVVFVWIVAAAAAVAVELLTADLTFAVIGVALAGAGVAAYVGVPLWGQFLIGAAVAAFGLLVVRPIALRQFRKPVSGSVTNVDALLGRKALVVHTTTSTGGLILLGGEEWSARSENEALTFDVGSTVLVTAIDGATAVIAAQPREHA